jgi:hypothetical protein
VLANIGYFAWQLVSEDSDVIVVDSRSARNGYRDDITLVSETDQTSSAKLQELVERPVIVLTRPENTNGCVVIGPFMSIHESLNVGNQLASLEFELEAKAVDLPTGEFDYRLLVPPMSSLEEAFRKLREFQASNIDSYVITAGENALGISLGVFSTRQAADIAMAKVRSEGFDGNVVEIPRLNRTYWLFNAPGLELAMNEIVWKNLTASNPDIEKRELPCEGIDP